MLSWLHIMCSRLLNYNPVLTCRVPPLPAPLSVCHTLQCGFIAQAPQPLSFTSFTPYFVPQSSGSQCFTQQPFNIRPYATPAIASSQANAFSNAGVAKSFADACAQAFGERTCCVVVAGVWGG